jgi:hypothetical protein
MDRATHIGLYEDNFIDTEQAVANLTFSKKHCQVVFDFFLEYRQTIICWVEKYY